MRYLPLTDADRAAMLAAVAASPLASGGGAVEGVDDLYRDVPSAARLREALDLPRHAGEIAVARALEAMAAENLPAGAAACFLGGCLRSERAFQTPLLRRKDRATFRLSPAHQTWKPHRPISLWTLISRCPKKEKEAVLCAAFLLQTSTL